LFYILKKGKYRKRLAKKMLFSYGQTMHNMFLNIEPRSFFKSISQRIQFLEKESHKEKSESRF